MSTRTVCLAIFFLTLGIDAVRLSQLSEQDLMFSPLPPAALRSWDEGINVAYSLVTGKGLANPFLSAPSGPSAYVPPAFPVETAAIFSLFGTGRGGAMARDVTGMTGYALLFALLPIFAPGLGMSRLAGTIAGFAAAIYPIYSPVDLFKGRDEWLAAIGGMLLLLFAVRLARAERLRVKSALLYGAGWGALMYVLPSMALILPVQMVIILLARSRRQHRSLFSGDQLRFTAIAAAAFVLAVLPWTVRNRMVMGGWFFMRDNVGFELDISNSDRALPSFLANAQSGWFCEAHPDCNQAIAERIGEVGEVEFFRAAGERAVSWIRDHPAGFAGLTVRRAFQFWFGLRADPISFALKALCWLLGLAGLVLMSRTGLKLEAAMLGTCWVIYPLVYYAVQYTERYPVAISPAILLPAGYATVQFYLNPRKILAIGSKN